MEDPPKQLKFCEGEGFQASRGMKFAIHFHYPHISMCLNTQLLIPQNHSVVNRSWHWHRMTTECGVVKQTRQNGRSSQILRGQKAGITSQVGGFQQFCLLLACQHDFPAVAIRMVRAKLSFLAIQLHSGCAREPVDGSFCAFQVSSPTSLY